MSSILHVIVGGSAWANAPIVYRRHRLAAYLTLQETTADVYWVFPSHGVGRRTRAPSDAQAVEHPDLSVGHDRNRIRELAVPTTRTVTRYSEALHRRLVRDVGERIRAHPARRKVLWLTVPFFSSLIRACAWDQVVYDCSDHWTGFRARRSLNANVAAVFRARSESRIIRRSTILFASSMFLQDRLIQTFGRAATLVENGVDVETFADPVPLAETGFELPSRPRLAFVGPLKNHRIHLDLLDDVAGAAPDWNIVLVGPAGRDEPALQRLLGRPNVFWLGPKHREEIPGIMKMMDVGMLPYRESAYNEGAFPLKFLEYLAAGLPVVGCGVPAISRYAEETVYVQTAAAPREFLAGCATALEWVGAAPRRLAIARENDWRARLACMHETVTTQLEP